MFLYRKSFSYHCFCNDQHSGQLYEKTLIVDSNLHCPVSAYNWNKNQLIKTLDLNT